MVIHYIPKEFVLITIPQYYIEHMKFNLILKQYNLMDNLGWNTNTHQYPVRRPVHGATTQNMMVCPPTNLNNNNWNRHQGVNQNYPNSLNNAGQHDDPLNVLFLAFRDQEQDGLIADGAAVDAVLGRSQDATVLGGNAAVSDNVQFN